MAAGPDRMTSPLDRLTGALAQGPASVILTHPDGTLTGYVAVREDGTARAQAEAERASLQAQLFQAQKMESLGSLAGGIAHDFNNILAAILSAAELMNQVLEPASPGRDALDIIFQAGRRAKELNRQILTFSRKGAEAWIPFDLSLVVSETLKLLHATLPKEVRVRAEVGAGLWVMGDPNQLHQVLLNMAVNAFHAMADGGGDLTITLETTRPAPAGAAEPPPQVRLAVRDTGCGMEAAVQARIFDPFFTTKAAREGTGLGLAVVQAIIHKHGGELKVTSAVGEGSLFEIFLPPTKPAAAPAPARTEAGTRGTERILVVDDEDLIAALIKTDLTAQGYDVTAKTSGLDALAAFTQEPWAFDLLVTDLGMPGLNGAALAERIHQIRPDLPAILFSGSIQELRQFATGPLAFQAIVEKPAAPEELRRAIRSVLHGRPAAPRPGPRSAAPVPAFPKTILLVEDDRETRALLRAQLSGEGYRVVEAGDGQQAWELYLSAPDPRHFSLIMTDIRMPRMDGLELVSRIRQRDPATPILVVTGSDVQVAEGTIQNLRIGEILGKAFDTRGLFARIRTLTGGGPVPAAGGR